MLAIEATLDGRFMTFETRVIRCDLAPWGRFRVGCADDRGRRADREFIARMADDAPEARPSERQPEVIEARNSLLG